MAILAIHVLDIALPQRFHQVARRPGALWRDEQMNVVGHQHIGMDATTVRANVFRETFQIEAVVFIGKETGLPVVPVLDEVR